ncbi:DUF4012 domain-containing protein [Cryobacterium sp. SO2]|uniref:DUF4012 domain-containing protein n=1 Tax=Cryobacterium sp. SO2 TaxID=1897060 RepID=UPI0023DB9F6D|nr:DUF4012 domain-containing protein [Cryobacterium sp. SO2]WEO77991.1 DUF4012 domain-containing protein [Cryobacterium sp. SO2]
MQQQVVDGDGEAARLTGVELGDRAASASALTSDPVWRMFEGIPALGPNLAVVRQLAAVVDDLAQDAVTPLADVAGAITTDDFKPVNGAINLQPLIDAQPAVSAAAVAVHAAQVQVAKIDTDGTVDQVAAAAETLRSAVADADTAITAVDNAVTLVPAILGANGPRDYMVLFQNPAELRATGGIAGAVALLHTDAGQIQLARQLSSGEFNDFVPPAIDLPTETRGIYGDITAQYIQDVNLTPNFVLSGEIASAMWQQQFGQNVNGVLSIDPIALGYLLAATGPVTLPTGDVLTSENATQLLLTDVYSRYPRPVDQDAFFAVAASTVFTAVAGGNADPVALIEALAKAGGEHRVLVWSADPAEQAVLADTTLAGGLPVSDSETQRFGVYLNDATGSKMGPYLDVQTAVGQATCRKDQRPQYAIDVTLTNTAPADAATSLPGYVTAAGTFGVTPGNIKTILSVYGAPDMQNLGLTRDGAEVAMHPATDATYPVSSLSVELAPGEITTVQFTWLGAQAFDGEIETQTTPVIHRNETEKLDITC